MDQDTDKWIGRAIEADDIISTERAFALWASLDSGEAAPQEGAPLPPLWRWLYFWVIGQRSEPGRDGHAALGGFLPAPADPRSNRPSPHHHYRCRSQEGSPGALTFVTLRHEISGAGGLAITED